MCETVRDEPYNAKADVWSAGITIIEMADIDPPHHEMNQMRVCFRITKSDPPTVINPRAWSSEFNNFLSKCLVKLPAGRATSNELLNHPFISNADDLQPLRLLYHEVRADVKETIEDLPEDTSTKDSDSVREKRGERGRGEREGRRERREEKEKGGEREGRRERREEREREREGRREREKGGERGVLLLLLLDYWFWYSTINTI